MKTFLICILFIGSLNCLYAKGAVVKRIVKRSDEVIELLFKQFKNTSGTKDNIPALLKKIIGKNPSAELVEYTRKYGDQFPDAFKNRKILKGLDQRPDRIPGICTMAKKLDSETFIEQLVFLPNNCTKFIKEIGPRLRTDELTTLARSLNGKPVSWRSLDKIFVKINKLDKNSGNIFEVIFLKQVNGKRLRKELPGIKKVISGQHNGVHGIDAIGCKNGKPVVIELKSGKVQLGDQLSEAWTLDKYNKFLDSPGAIDKLRKLGIDEKFLVKQKNIRGIERRLVKFKGHNANGFAKTGMKENDIVNL